MRYIEQHNDPFFHRDIERDRCIHIEDTHKVLAMLTFSHHQIHMACIVFVFLVLQLVFHKQDRILTTLFTFLLQQQLPDPSNILVT